MFGSKLSIIREEKIEFFGGDFENKVALKAVNEGFCAFWSTKNIL